MNEKFKRFGTLSLAKELSRNEQKKILGGTGGSTVCTGGTYAIGCQPAYCTSAGHGTCVSCTDGSSCNTGGGGSTNPCPSCQNTVCTGGTYYNIGCQPAYCAAAGHGSYVSCN